MLGFDHPNVLSLLGVCFDTEQNLPLIILPYMANGDLKTFLLKCRGDNEPYVLPTVSHVSCIIKISTNTMYAFLRQTSNIVLQLISFNRNPVNRNFRKWVGCEALAPIQDNDDCFDRYHNEPLSCMGAKASQPTHFLKFRLTGFRLSEINCILCNIIMLPMMISL